MALQQGRHSDLTDQILDQRLRLMDAKIDAIIWELRSTRTRNSSPPPLSSKIFKGLSDPEAMPWVKMALGALILKYVAEGGDLTVAIGWLLKLASGS